MHRKQTLDLLEVNPRHTAHSGITLIELIVTIAIVAILMTLAAPSFVTMHRNSARTARLARPSTLPCRCSTKSRRRTARWISRRRRRSRSARTTSCRRSSPARCSRPSSTSSRRRAWIAAAAESRSRRSPRRRKHTSSAWSGRICKGIPRRAGRLTFVGRPAYFCAKCLNLTN